MGKKRRLPEVALGPRIIALFALERVKMLHCPGVKRAAERLSGKEYRVTLLHAVLRRLEAQGFVMSRPRKDPYLGNYRRYYWITQAGKAALNEIRRVIEATKVPSAERSAAR